jgi:hypothetical protein
MHLTTSFRSPKKAYSLQTTANMVQAKPNFPTNQNINQVEWEGRKKNAINITNGASLPNQKPYWREAKNTVTSSGPTQGNCHSISNIQRPNAREASNGGRGSPPPAAEEYEGSYTVKH